MPTATSPQPLHRSRRFVLVIVAALALWATAACDGAAMSSAMAVNQTREAVGRPALTLDAGLSTMAESHARAMANSGRLYHSASANRPPAGFHTVGENVGRGYTTTSVHRALVASRGHYGTMTSTAYRAFGVGSAYGSDGNLYVAQLFAG